MNTIKEFIAITFFISVVSFVLTIAAIITADSVHDANGNLTLGQGGHIERTH